MVQYRHIVISFAHLHGSSQLLKYGQEVVQPEEVAVLVVSGCPWRTVVHRHGVGQATALGEVDQPHPGPPALVMHEQQRATHHLHATNKFVTKRAGLCTSASTARTHTHVIRTCIDCYYIEYELELLRQ